MFQFCIRFFTKYLVKTQLYSGFTLSEVLVTLAVIGVVAAMTIPVINNARNAELNSAARKAFSVASQAYLQAVADNGGGFGMSSVFDNVAGSPLPLQKFNALKSKLNIVKECPFSSGSLGACWAKSSVGSGPVNPSDCGAYGVNGQNNHTAFVTSDGMFWMLYSYSATTGQPWLTVDVNGERKPNDWGKDVFLFELGDTSIKFNNLYCGSGKLKHNDGTTVSQSEFSAPFIQ